jgi:two-component system, NtrC family, nitrogen regulation sensor histidine kinase NtrY
MIFRRFQFLSILRIMLILLNVIVLISILGDDRLFFNQIILGSILILQVWDLIRFVNVTNRELTKFFNAVQQADFTINFTRGHLGNSFSGLFESMQSLIETYKKVKIEKEAQFHLLQQIIAHVPAGIFVIAEMDSIILMNESAKRILNVSELKSWKGLKAKAPNFSKIIFDLPSSGRFLIDILINSETKTLSLDLNHFTLLDKEYDLISFSDIKNEVEQKEIEAWHRLIRILTHEIMNSITPISSLTETMQLLLSDKNSKPKLTSSLTNQTISDLLFSLNTIQKRSDGLLHFVDDYRRLTKVPKPDLENVLTKDLFESVIQLMSSDLESKKIKVNIKAAQNHIIQLDRNLIEQVLINLVKNSIDALGKIENPVINLTSFPSDRYDLIVISDNGSGIDDKQKNDIWVPFYTTKESGSGIGLSLAKQVMKLHHGTIRMASGPDQLTTFILEFLKKTNT